MNPLVRDTVPFALKANVFAPVVTLPAVSVSVPLTVRSPPASVTPFALLIVRFWTERVAGISAPVVRAPPSGWELTVSAPRPRVNDGATSYEPPAVRSPLLPVTVWTASAAPVPSVSLLLLVTVPRDRLTLSVGVLEVPVPSVTPEGVSNVIVWSGLDTD